MEKMWNPDHAHLSMFPKKMLPLKLPSETHEGKEEKPRKVFKTKPFDIKAKTC